MMRVDLVRFDHITPNYPVQNLQETNVWQEQTRISKGFWGTKTEGSYNGVLPH